MRLWKRSVLKGAAVAMCYAAAAPAAMAQQDTTKTDKGSELLRSLEALAREVERMESGATEPLPEIVMINGPGSYPPGRYIGRCEAKRRPENPQIGDSYEVRYVSSSFFRQEEDESWNGVGVSSPPYGAAEYVCAADERDKDRAFFLGEDWEGSIRGPGKYKLVITGYIEHYVVKSCSGEPCPLHVDRQEIEQEIPFEIGPGQ
jgi:hypothetical protein